jgi:winged helix DNA-binding protein
MSAALRRLRARRQRLHRPAGGPGEIVRALLAVQAQDRRGASLALRARGTGFGATDVESALGEDLLVAWLLRGTLHLVAREDHPWLLALTAPRADRANRRRLEQEQVEAADVERAVDLIASALGDDGPQTRAELGERLERAGIRTAGQALPHLLMRAALDGAIVIGPGARFERAAPAGAIDRNAALAELARRWLVAHGPGTDRDLAGWAGLPLRDARAALSSIAGELTERDGLVDLERGDQDDGRLGARLLPVFDDYLLGWRDRSFALAPQDGRRVHPSGGIIRAVATVDGRAVGTWTAPGGEVAIEWFGEAAGGFGAECADVARFLRA